MSVLGALWIACPYAWRVHERISHACSGREIGPSAQVGFCPSRRVLLSDI